MLLNEPDIAGVLKTLSEDIDWFIPGPEEIIPFAGRRRGPQQVAEFFSALRQSRLRVAGPVRIITSGVCRYWCDRLADSRSHVRTPSSTISLQYTGG